MSLSSNRRSRLKLLFAVALATGLLQGKAIAETAADEGEDTTASARSKTKLESAIAETPVKKKDGEVDTDEVITNRQLRASTGAKKRYSFSAALTYSGGTLDNPFSATRPNITGSVGTQIAPRLNGTVAARYRLSPVQTLSASVGVGVDRPFHSDPNRTYLQRSSAQNPSVGYSVMYRALGVQNVTSIGAGLYTTEFLRSAGYVAGPSVSQTLIYDFGGSKASIGTSLSVGYAFFDKDAPELAAQQANISIGAFPFFEYVISDRLNFRTLIGFMADHTRAAGSFWTWVPNTVYQSAGIGISITRDIFLYPNIQLIPEDIRMDRTNVALNATINL